MPELDQLSELDDTALVALAIEELPYVTRAYETLMQRYYRLMFSACQGMLRNQDDAEETVQDVMLKVFNALQKFEGRASFKTWLMKIATNTCITRSQKRKRDTERFVEDSDGSLEQNAASRYDDPAVAEDSFETLVQNLTDEEQQILTLRFVGELNIPEIAEVLGIGLSASKMRYYRALEKLKSEQL